MLMLSTNIKEATTQAHQKLEKKVVQKLKAIRSNEDYADLLRHFYAYFSHLEKAIAEYITPDLLPDYKDRRNSSYLKRDIEELGSTVNDLPETNVPEISGPIQALGALYVMEGSIMGGRIIVQMLEKYGVTKGVSFFSGYQEATGQMWGTFTGVLNQAAKTDEDQVLAIQAANETFANFSDVFGDVQVA